jgi:sugar/nucleoside kinase (ribokinase family)
LAEARIVVAGDVIDDVVVVPHGAIRTDTDTTSTIAMRPGGSPANTAAWLGALGASVDFVGVVGIDDVERHTALLERHGVRAHLAGHPSAPTGTIVVLVEGERRAMLTERGANADFDPDAVGDDLLAGATALLVTGHSLAGRTDAAAIRELVTRARVAGVAVVVAPGSAGHIADVGADVFRTAFAGAEVVIASLDEAHALAGLDEAHALAGLDEAHALAGRGNRAPASGDAAGVTLAAAEAAAKALADFAATVVVTLGGAGAYVARFGMVPAVPAHVVDPTGAGDAFAAGFLAEWVRSRDAVAAAGAGASIAARAVRLVGGRPL